MKKLAISALVALGLVGCQATTQSPFTTQKTAPATQNTQVTTQKFECNNGLTVTVKYLNTEQIQLTTQNYSAVLDITPSGSGSRYASHKGLFGYGGEWHENGRQAHFAYKGVHGNSGETTCTVG